MLLIDEIDRADDEFEAFLLEVLSDFQITIPEIGTVARPPAPGGRADLQPHARAARRAQAPLPVPLDRAPDARARDRDRAPARARRARAAGRRDGRVRRRPARPGPGEGARRGRDDRLDAGARRARLRGARRGGRRADARRGPEVLRGLRAASATRRSPRWSTRRARRPRPRRGERGPHPRHRHASAACCARPGSRSGRAGSPTRCAAWTASTSRARTTSTGRCARRSCARREDLEPFDRAFDAWFLRREPGARRRAASSTRGSCARTPGACAATRAQARGGARRRRARQHRPQRPRGAAPQGLRGDDPRGARRRARADRRDGDATGPSGARTACARTGAGASSTCAGSRAPRSPPAATRSRARFRRRVEAPRKLVVLCDVSGSMEPYTRALLLYLHAVGALGPRRRGLRLRHAADAPDAPSSRTRDPEQALARAAARVVDWASGHAHRRVAASVTTTSGAGAR